MFIEVAWSKFRFIVKTPYLERAKGTAWSRQVEAFFLEIQNYSLTRDCFSSSFIIIPTLLTVVWEQKKKFDCFREK